MKNTSKLFQYFLILFTASGFFIATISNTTFASEIPRNWLVAEYLFDGNANDTSGNGNNGIATNVTFENGNALFSKWDYITFPTTWLPFWNNPRSLSTWVKFNSFSWDDSIFGYWSENTEQNFFLNYYNHDWFYLRGVFWWNDINTNRQLTLWQYYHLALVYDWSIATLYVNGVIAWSKNILLKTIGSFGSFGKYSNWSPTFDGAIKKARIYNRALSDSEIQVLSHEWEAPSCHDGIKNQDETSIDLWGVCWNIPRDWLVAEYLFDGNTNDTSGNGNNWTSINVTFEDGNAIFNRWDYITFPTTWLPLWSNPRSMSTWVKFNSFSWDDSIFGYWLEDTEQNFFLNYYNHDWFYLRGVFWWNDIDTNQQLMLWQYYHLVLVYDWSVAKLYINDTMIWIKNILLRTTGSVWSFGKYANRPPTFDGAIKKARIYNRALSDSEVQALYNEGTYNPTPPTPLSQQIQSPQMDPQEIISPQDINLWEKVWKFQSGSGVILSANVDNTSWKKLRVDFEVYKLWDILPSYSKSTEYSYLLTHKITVPYLWAWEYLWKVRATDEWWNSSEWVDFWINNSYSADYGLYEWFEPYPYGYKFHNREIASGVLYGLWFNLIFRQPPAFPLILKEPTIVDWNKWDIFRNAFDLSSLQNNKKKMIDAFDALWLNKTDALSHWSCYGMAVSSAMQYTHSGFINTYYPSFSNAIWAWMIWDNIFPLSTDWPYGYSKWNSYSKTLETILSFQLSQRSVHVQKAISKGTKSPDEIIKELKEFPNNTYALLFWWKDRNNKEVWHAVIPYKVEGNKIYIWDNNYQYPFRLLEDWSKEKWYNQYIEIYTDTDWKIKWKANTYKWKSFTKMSLINLDDIFYSWKKSAPFWLNGNDISLTLSWSSDMYISDSLWRVSWFTSSGVVEEIPGVEVIVPLNATLDWATEDNFRQIYLPQKIDWLTIKVSWKSDEAYDLMMAWWDYYTKISWVSTNSWQTDSYNISREQLQIDFDDSKTWNYSFMVDDFQNDWTGSIYRWDLKSITNLQKYSIDWQKVIANNEESIKYEVDTNNDWIYDLESYYSSFPISPDEKWSISWYVKWDSNASMAGWKICIDTNKNGTCEENKEPFQITDNKWYYEFKDLSSKEYSIIEIPHQNWKITKPTAWKYWVYLNNWQKIKNVNFENTFTKWKGK